MIKTNIHSEEKENAERTVVVAAAVVAVVGYGRGRAQRFLLGEGFWLSR